MNTITESIKQAAKKEVISLKSALAIVALIDKEREETIELLKRLEKNVGMMQGEEINIHIANMKGQKFNSVEYFFERMPEEQRH